MQTPMAITSRSSSTIGGTLTTGGSTKQRSTNSRISKPKWMISTSTSFTSAVKAPQFGAHGGDWGSTVTEQLARSHPDAVVAIHLTDVPFGHLFEKPHDPSPAERQFFDLNDKWLPKEGAYATIRSSKPQSLAHGLNDSPAGLASWLVEKFRAWSDCDGEIESRFTKDELLTQVMIY